MVVTDELADKILFAVTHACDPSADAPKLLFTAGTKSQISHKSLFFLLFSIKRLLASFNMKLLYKAEVIYIRTVPLLTDSELCVDLINLVRGRAGA